MVLTPEPAPVLPRNPGPEWGYRFLARADAVLPAPLFEGLLRAGSAVAVAMMPRARRHSRAYLTAVLGRPARTGEVWRHFSAFADSTLRRLRAARGRGGSCRPGPGMDGFRDLMVSGRPAFLGTFHVGDSDLIGFLLAEFRRPIRMIRQKVGNSSDTAELGGRYGQWVRFLWSNDWAEMLVALKEAIAAGESIAMKCDRPDHSSRRESFRFLGARREFPFTIYHLAILFRLPVVFCLGVPFAGGDTEVVGSAVFDPAGWDREEGLARAREHFQQVLDSLEALLRRRPYLWFNFTPLNPAG